MAAPLCRRCWYIVLLCGLSFIQNVYSRRNQAPSEGYRDGIRLNSDFNTLIGNTCQKNGIGIYLNASNNNTLIGNTSQGNGDGIALETSDNNIISGNTCQGNENGITIYASNNNIISGNTSQGNRTTGFTFTLLTTTPSQAIPSRGMARFALTLRTPPTTIPS